MEGKETEQAEAPEERGLQEAEGIKLEATVITVRNGAPKGQAEEGEAPGITAAVWQQVEAEEQEEGEAPEQVHRVRQQVEAEARV
jgi:hypothetical protein